MCSYESVIEFWALKGGVVTGIARDNAKKTPSSRLVGVWRLGLPGDRHWSVAEAEKVVRLKGNTPFKVVAR